MKTKDTLHLSVTAKSNGEKLYVVAELATGRVVARRFSKRDYVAAYITYSTESKYPGKINMAFGRIDLILKELKRGWGRSEEDQSRLIRLVDGDILEHGHQNPNVVEALVYLSDSPTEKIAQIKEATELHEVLRELRSSDQIMRATLQGELDLLKRLREADIAALVKWESIAEERGALLEEAVKLIESLRSAILEVDK